MDEFITWLDRWQTLVAGVLALVAAGLAGFPVWRQVRDGRLQTLIALREALQSRLQEAEARQAEAERAVSEPFDLARRGTREPDGEPRTVDGHTAHMLDGQFSGAAGRLKAPVEDALVEAAKDRVDIAFAAVTSDANAVHWIEWNEQSGDDYSYSDEEWADAGKRAEEAAAALPARVDDAIRAFNSLRAARMTVAIQMAARIGLLDRKIARAI